MARQDIFAALSDDVLGERCTTSSLRGKVRRIETWVNTDCCGELFLSCGLTDDKKKLICSIRATEEDKVDLTLPKKIILEQIEKEITPIKSD